MKLRKARSQTRLPLDSASYERPDELYAIFERATVDTPAPDDPSPMTDAIRTSIPSSSSPEPISLSERLAPREQAPVYDTTLARRATDEDLRRAAVESRLAALTIMRRRAAESRVAAIPKVIVLPPNPPTPEPAPVTLADEAPPEAMPPQPLINTIPLPPAIAADSARLALAALRAAARLVPLLLLPHATRLETSGATRALTRLGVRTLAAWVDTWGRRPVVQLFRTSASPAFNRTVIQYLLADQLAVALASDAALAHDVELLNRTLGARVREGQ
ncbi:MAG: hypothetical protein HXY39_20145 [Chloroflexi bacterium]|nr:hypothetical protein [Chloroflexota bacterium]